MSNYTHAEVEKQPEDEVLVDGEELSLDDIVVEEQAIVAEPVVEVAPVAVDIKPVEPVEKQSVVQDHPYNYDAIWDMAAEIFDLPGNTTEKVTAALEKAPLLDLGDNPESRLWAMVIARSLQNATFKDAFLDTLKDKNAEFHQMVMHNGMRLELQSPPARLIENKNIKGEGAVLHVMSQLGLGTLYQVPLWHTGMWIKFKPPSESAIIELNRQMMADKINFGRNSYGLAYSSTTGYTIERLVNFALSHVYDTTIKNDEIAIDQLRDIISAQDIPTLLWGFVCTLYPKGFQYQRACTTDPEKCQHVSQEKLNLTKLLWVNTLALTDWQKTHMSERQAKQKDKASVLRYMEELKATANKTITIKTSNDSEIQMTLKSPTVTEYISSAHTWIGDIVSSIEKAIDTDATSDEKETLIQTHSQAAALRQYTHWVNSIEVDTNIINDTETLQSVLNTFSSDTVISESFYNEVGKYINESTIAVVGIPVYDCPKCNSSQETNEYPKFTNIIPIDVVQVFFDLITLRLERVQTR